MTMRIAVNLTFCSSLIASQLRELTLYFCNNCWTACEAKFVDNLLRVSHSSLCIVYFLSFFSSDSLSAMKSVAILLSCWWRGLCTQHGTAWLVRWWVTWGTATSTPCFSSTRRTLRKGTSSRHSNVSYLVWGVLIYGACKVKLCY